MNGCDKNMSIKALVSANFMTLYSVIKKQFSKHTGLHLNSADWKPHIDLGQAKFYNFLLNGCIRASTETPMKGTAYEQVIQFDKYKDIENSLLLMYLAKIPEEDITTFIATFLFNTRTRVFCTCPAFKFWGFEYILTRKNSVFGPGEFRFPIEKNPHLYGAVCKHLWLVMESFNNKQLKFAKMLVPLYKRAFGINTEAKLDKFRNSLKTKGIMEVLESAREDLNFLKNRTIIKEFDRITKDKLQEVIKPKPRSKILKNDDQKEKKMEPFMKGYNRILKNDGSIQRVDETKDIDMETLTGGKEDENK